MIIDSINDRLLVDAANSDLSGIELSIAKGASIEAKDDEGNTALHYAIGVHEPTYSYSSTEKNDILKCIDRLISYGAAIDAANQAGDTPLHRSAVHCLPDAATILLANNADPTILNAAGYTPAGLAKAYLRDNLAAFLASAEDQKRLNNAIQLPYGEDQQLEF